MDASTEQRIGAQLGEIMRRDPSLSTQQLQAIVQDLLGDDQSLRTLMRELIQSPGFMRSRPLAGGAENLAFRDALLIEMRAVFQQQLLDRAGLFLNGYLGLVSQPLLQPVSGRSLPAGKEPERWASVPAGNPAARVQNSPFPAAEDKPRLARPQGDLLLLLLPILGISGFLLFWQLSASLGLTKLAGPLSLFTAERTRELLFYPFFDRGGLDKGLFLHAMNSLSRVALGYSLAAVVGIAVGIAVGLNKALDRAFDPLFQFLRMVAPLAWVPIALVLFQNAHSAAIFVIFITAIWPIILNTAEGFRPSCRISHGTVAHSSRRRLFTKVLIPSALPSIFSGLRIAIGLAWMVIIAVEIVIPGTPGIGFFIWDAYQNSYVVSDIVLGVIWIGAIGLVLDRLIIWLQKRITAFMCRSRL